MSLLSHFLTRPPVIREFQPYQPMRETGFVERAGAFLDRFSIAKIVGVFLSLLSGTVVVVLLMVTLFGGLFL